MLYTHQQKIINDDPTKTGLFLGTGSGKTRIALLLARGRTLVIAPKTQVEDENWQREAKKLNLDIKLTVISKETFRRDAYMLPSYDTIIVDEAHTCLGATPNLRYVKKQAVPKTSQLYEELSKYVSRTNPSRLYLCTATIIRSPMTVWAAARLLGCQWNFYQFREAFYVKLPMPGRDVWSPKTDTATKERLARAVRSLGYTGQLSDYFDVPDQTYKDIFLELTAKQKERLKSIKLDYPDPLVQCIKKNQIENGVLAGDEFNEPEVYPNAKIDTIIDLSVEFPRMVVFAKYTAQIAQIATALRKEGKKVFILEGATKDRGALIQEANASLEYVFIAQAQVSAGWELPECPVMVFASLDWSVVSYIQGQGRILRANALKKNLYIHLIIKGGVDEKVYKSIKNKEDFNLAIYENKEDGRIKN